MVGGVVIPSAAANANLQFIGCVAFSPLLSVDMDARSVTCDCCLALSLKS